MRLHNGLVIIIGLALAACGGGDDNNNNVDAGNNDGNNNNNGGCLIAQDLGTIAPVVNPGGISKGNPADPWFVEAKAPFNNETPLPDWWVIRLFDMTQVFPNDLTPGTFTLAGNELDYSVCGVCVLLVGDHTGDRAEEVNNAYMATSGTVTVNSVIPTFSATLSDLTFQHVFFTEPEMFHIPNDSGCTTRVDSLTFSVDIQALPVTIDDDGEFAENGRVRSREKSQ